MPAEISLDSLISLMYPPLMLEKFILECKDEIRRLQNERDVYRLIAIDETQARRGLARDKATTMVDQYVWEHLRILAQDEETGEQQ